MDLTSTEVRQMFKAGDDIRDAGLTTPDDIIRYDDILYGSDQQWQVLDVYRPKNATGKLPVIISVHGGAWVYGDKERYQYYCMNLAQRGFAVINFTYRLAPEFKFPAPLEDTNSVIKWMFDHAEEYQLDTDYVFAVGDSAGAHILSLYTIICTSPVYATNFTFKCPKDGFVFNAVALNCGAYDVANSNSMNLMNEYMPHGGTEEEIELITVWKHVTPDFPQTYLMTSCDDFLCDQPPIMAAKFTEYKIPFIYRMYGDKNNPLAHVFHCNIRLEDATICNDDECNFFKTFIK